MVRKLARKKKDTVGVGGGGSAAAAQIDAWASTREREFDSEVPDDTFSNPISGERKRPVALGAVCGDGGPTTSFMDSGDEFDDGVDPTAEDAGSREKDFDFGGPAPSPAAAAAPPVLSERMQKRMEKREAAAAAASVLAAGPHVHVSAAQMIEKNEAQIKTESTDMVDLRHAFMAVDLDGNGWIDTAEFSMMLTVLGCNVSGSNIQTIIDEAKDGFETWKLMADDENRQKCRDIWGEFDLDNSGTLDLAEINGVIAIEAANHGMPPPADGPGRPGRWVDQLSRVLHLIPPAGRITRRLFGA